MIQVPGYILTKKLGVGGMATVYLALQTSLQRQVALKVMAPAFAADRSFANRFVAEARTIAELNHPNIVAVHDVGVTEAGLHYFAMQYLPNGDLQSRIDAGIRERELIRVLLGVCSALEHAHQRGFVHRDVTPGNVLFDNAGMPVLTDFGIARVVTEATRMTATGLSLGTSHYMSPEQARGRRVDFRSDLYSLGAVAFEALVGRPPYDGDDSFAVAYAHVYDPLPKVPERLSRWQPFIDRAMAKDPSERFQSAAEVRTALQDYLDRTSENGRRTPDVPARSDDEAPTVPLETHRVAGDSRLRWLKLALGRRPRDWLTGIAPALKWGAAWLADVVSGWRAKRWLGASLVLLLLVVVGVVWLSRPAGQLPAPEPVVADAPSATEPAAPATTEPAAPATIEPAAPGTTEPGVEVVSETPPQRPPEIEPEPEREPAGEPQGDAQDLAEVPSFEPDDPALVDLENGEVINTAQTDDATTRQFRERVQGLVAAANQDLSEEKLTTPADDNALQKFEAVLSLDPNNIQARDGLERIVLRYVAMARARIRDGRYDLARLYQRRGTEVAERHGLQDRFRRDLASIDDFGYQTAIDAAREAVQREALERAEQSYRQALEFRPGDARASAELDSVLNPEPVGPVIVTDTLGDGSTGPEMVVVDLGGQELAVGATEVTVDLFGRFMAAAGDEAQRRPACRHLESMWRTSRRRTWDSPGFDQSPRHPVVCVSWQDAAAFATWLSAETGRRYRLPSKAEWLRLVAGAAPQPCQRNLGDAALAREHPGRRVFECDDGWSYTAPAGSYPGSDLGLFDTSGNVREWVQDCAKTGRGDQCRERAVMGSAWMDGPDDDLVDVSESFDEDRAYTTVGFRLVRE